MEVPYTLRDGAYLLKGAYICVDAWDIENDLCFVPDPELFDRLRGYRVNQPEGPDGMKRFFTSVKPMVLGLSYGRIACLVSTSPVCSSRCVWWNGTVSSISSPCLLSRG